MRAALNPKSSYRLKLARRNLRHAVEDFSRTASVPLPPPPAEEAVSALLMPGKIRTLAKHCISYSITFFAICLCLFGTCEKYSSPAAPADGVRARETDGRDASELKIGVPNSDEIYARAAETFGNIHDLAQPKRLYPFEYKNGLFGFCGGDGKVVFEPRYTAITDEPEFGYMFAHDGEGGVYMLKSDGSKSIYFPYGKPVSVFRDGDWVYAAFSDGGETSVYREDGRFMFSREGLGTFYNGRAPARSGFLWGITDINGEWTTEPRWLDVRCAAGDKFAACDNGRWGVADRGGEAVSRFVYDGAYVYDDGTIRLSRGVDTAAWYNPLSGRLLEGAWTRAEYAGGGVWKFRGKDGLLLRSEHNTHGEIIPGVTDVSHIGGGMFAAARGDGKYGVYVFNKGYAIQPGKLTGAFFDGKYITARDSVTGKVGIFSADGREILPPEFDSVRVSGDFFTVRQGERSGVINASGKWVLRVNADYSSLSPKLLIMLNERAGGAGFRYT